MENNLSDNLTLLKLAWMRDNLDLEVAEAARKNRPIHEIIRRLVEGEIAARQSRAIERRLRQAKVPKRPSLNTFDFHWPQRINADQVRHLFSLNFMKDHTNVVFIGSVGVGKTHLATALVVQACEQRKNALFTSAAEMINTLVEAQTNGNFGSVIKRYLRVDLLLIDELGYLPIDKLGAEILFQVLAGRYEKASTIITSNRVYSDWNKTFANDNAMTSAVLDRVIHHCETVVIEGGSYRMKGRLDDE